MKTPINDDNKSKQNSDLDDVMEKMRTEKRKVGRSAEQKGESVTKSQKHLVIQTDNSQADEEVSEFLISKMNVPTLQVSKEAKTPINFQVGPRFEVVGATTQDMKKIKNTLIESLDTDLRRPVEHAKKSKEQPIPQASFTVQDENRSNRIFNLQNRDNFNMLLNQDKFQNPTDILRAQFDLVSGPSMISSEAARAAHRVFGQTPIGGMTFINESASHKEKVAKLKKDIREGKTLSQIRGSPKKQPDQKQSMLKQSIKEKLPQNMITHSHSKDEQSDWTKQFHKPPPGVEGHIRSKSYNLAPYTASKMVETLQTLQFTDAPTGLNITNNLIHSPSFSHQNQHKVEVYNIDNLHQTAGSLVNRHPGYQQNNLQTIPNLSRHFRNKSPQVRQGFGVANKMLRTLVVVEEKNGVGASKGIRQNDLTHVNQSNSIYQTGSFDGPGKYERDWYLKTDKSAYQNDVDMLLKSSPNLQSKITRNIHNGRIDVIRLKQEMKIKQAQQKLPQNSSLLPGLFTAHGGLSHLYGSDQNVSGQMDHQQRGNQSLLTSSNDAKKQPLGSNSFFSTVTGTGADGIHQGSSQVPNYSNGDRNSGSMISMHHIASSPVEDANQSNPAHQQGYQQAHLINEQNVHSGGLQNHSLNHSLAQAGLPFRGSHFPSQDINGMVHLQYETFNQKQSDAGLGNNSFFMNTGDTKLPQIRKTGSSQPRPLMLNQQSQSQLTDPTPKELSVQNLHAFNNISSHRVLEEVEAGSSQRRMSEYKYQTPLGSKQVTSNIFNFSDVRRVLDKNIKMLEKPQGANTEMKKKKIFKMKKPKAETARTMTYSEINTNRHMSDKREEPLLRILDSNDRHMSYDTTSLSINKTFGQPQLLDQDPNLTYPYRQKQEFILKMTSQGFGYERDQFNDAKLALSAERNNKSIGTTAQYPIQIDFEKREKRAKIDKIKKFQTIENPLMTFQVNEKQGFYRKEGEQYADIQQIKQGAQTTVQLMAYETQKDKKDRIIHNFVQQSSPSKNFSTNFIEKLEQSNRQPINDTKSRQVSASKRSGERTVSGNKAKLQAQNMQNSHDQRSISNAQINQIEGLNSSKRISDTLEKNESGILSPKGTSDSAEDTSILLNLDQLRTCISNLEKKYQIRMTNKQLIIMLDALLAIKDQECQPLQESSASPRKPKSSKLTAEVLQDEQRRQQQLEILARGLVLGGEQKQRVRLDVPGVDANYMGNKNQKGKVVCTCGIRDFLKELMKRVKGFDNRLGEFHEEVARRRAMQGVSKGKALIQPCVHDLEKEEREKEHEEALKKLETFIGDLHVCGERNKVLKPDIFKAFVKHVLDDDSLERPIQHLQAYIKAHNLHDPKAVLDYVNFFDHNINLAMKKKNKKKLKEGDLAKINLEGSSDSSIEETNDGDEENQTEFQKKLKIERLKTFKGEAKYMYGAFKPGLLQMFENQLKAVKESQKQFDQNKQLLVYQPDPVTGLNQISQQDDNQSASSKNNNKPSQNHFNISLNRQVVINEKIFKNFVGKLVPEGEDAIEVFVTEQQSDLNTQQKLERTQKMLKQATLDCIEHVKISFERIVEIKKAQEMALNAPQRRSSQVAKAPKQDPHKRLAQFQDILNEDARKIEVAARQQHRDLEKKKAEIDNQQRDKFAKLQLQQPKPGADTQQEGQNDAKTVVQMIQKSKQLSKDSHQMEIKVYDKERQRQVFYQMAKFFVEHPNDNYQEKDAHIIQFYQDCLIGNNSKNDPSNQFEANVPKPLFLKMVTDNVLSIRNASPSLTICNAMKNLLKIAEKNKVREYQIQKFILDQSKIDDQKLSHLLEGLLSQTTLNSIVLMNCQVGWNSFQAIVQLLTREGTAEITELRFVNVQFLIDASKQQKLKNDVMYEQMMDPSLIKKQNTYKRPLIGTLLKHLKNNMKKQIFLKRLQLSWVSMGVTWEGYYNVDSTKYIVKLLEGDRGSQLEELDLSHSQMNLLQFWKISESLQNTTENLKYLSLKGLNLLEMANSYKSAEVGWNDSITADEIVDNLISYVKLAPHLQHLNLSNMGLGRTLIRVAKEAIKPSVSLLAVHLTQNNLALLDIEELLEVFDIDHSQVLQLIRKSMGAVEQEDTLGLRGQTCDNVKGLIYQAQVSSGAQQSTAQFLRSQDHQNLKEEPSVNDYLRHDLQKHYSHQQQNMKAQRTDGSQRIFSKNLNSRLLLQRKKGFKTTLFDDSVQSRMFSEHRHFGLFQLSQNWQVRFREEECYVCNKYQNYQIFYQRSKANQQFTKIENKLEISALKMHIKLQQQGHKEENPATTSDSADPYHRLPLLLGTLLDESIPSMRLINVKHQAALLWSIKHVQGLKGKNVEEKQAEVMRNCIKAVLLMMRNGDVRSGMGAQEGNEVNEKVIAEMMQSFVAWRELLGISHEFDEKKGDLRQGLNNVIVNFPVFRKQDAGEEDDIFYLEGFFKSGTHSLIIYDPVLDAFFKRENLFVGPRTADLHQMKDTSGPKLNEQVAGQVSFGLNDDFGPAGGGTTGNEGEPDVAMLTKVYAARARGPGFFHLQANIFGDLLHDMSKRLSQTAFQYDFDSKVVDIKLFLYNQKSINKDQLSDLVRKVSSSYHMILKLWNCLYFQMGFERKTLQEEEQIFKGAAHILAVVMKDSSLENEVKKLKKKLKEDPVLKVLKEVHDTIKMTCTGVRQPHSLQEVKAEPKKSIAQFQVQIMQESRQKALIENFGHQMLEKIEMLPASQRRVIPLALLRLFSMVSENILGTGTPAELYERYITQCCNRFFSHGLAKNNLKHLRKQMIFLNKPLLTFLKINKQLIRKSLYERYFCTMGGESGRMTAKGVITHQTFTLNPRVVKNNKLLESSLELFTQDLQKIAKNLPGARIQSSLEMTLGDDNLNHGENQPEKKVEDKPPLIEYETLKRLALECKLSILHQDFESSSHSNHLTFEEFTLFICQLAVYLYNFDARDQFDKGCGKQIPPDENLFFLSSFPKSGSKKPLHIEMALNLQQLLVDLKSQKLLKDDIVPFEEMDLSVFKDYVDLLQNANVGNSAMSLGQGGTEGAAGGAAGQSLVDGSTEQELRVSAMKLKKARMKEDSSEYSDGYDEV